LDGSAPSSNVLARQEPIEDLMYTTSNDLIGSKIYKRTASTANATSFFGAVLESDIKISNGLETVAAHGSGSAYDIPPRALKVSGKLKGAFETINHITDIQNDAKFGYYNIWGRAYNNMNTGIIVDLPLLDCTSKGVTPKPNADLVVEIDFEAKRDNNLNEVISFCFFDSLPNIALA
jgi:hypothetical protein